MGELVAELCELIIPWRVRDVEPHPPRDLIIVLEPPPGATNEPALRRLRLSAHPEAARFHLQRGRLPKHSGPSSAFFQRVAQELQGAECARIEQVGGDRILAMEWRQTAAGARRSLLLELTGRHANLFLLGAQDELLDWLVPVPAGKSGPRLLLGQIWRPPGGAARAPSGPSGPTLSEAFAAPDSPPPGPDRERAPLSWRVECALGAQAESARAEELGAKLRARLGRRIERTEALLQGLLARAQACADSGHVQQDGELLKANLAQVSRGQSVIEVTDWFSADGSPRRIALDPKLSPPENLARIFERAKKLERAAHGVDAEIALARERLTRLQELRTQSEDSQADPLALEAAAIQAGLLEPAQEADPRKRSTPAARLPYRSFVGLRGSEIRVGRSAADNDELTLRHSRGGDVWLHTADAPGSHVVLRLEKGAQADEEELLDAAHLAVHYSPLRGAHKAAVHVAARKLVHKPRGAKPGLVSLSGGRTLQLRVQPERLERLLHSHRPTKESGPS